MPSNESVTVGCKLPHGFMLQLRDPKFPEVVLEERRLSGTMTDIKPFVKEDSVSFTKVDADFWATWEAWAKQNKFAPFVNGYIFAGKNAENARAEGKEKAKLMTGLEQLRPKDESDSRMAEFRAAKLDKFSEEA